MKYEIRLYVQIPSRFWFANVFECHLGDLAWGRERQKRETNKFWKECKIYPINSDPSLPCGCHFEGTFLQLWKRWMQSTFFYSYSVFHLSNSYFLHSLVRPNKKKNTHTHFYQTRFWYFLFIPYISISNTWLLNNFIFKQMPSKEHKVNQ